MARRRAPFKRKDATTFVYNPTFPVHMKTRRKNSSTTTVYHPLFPAPDPTEASPLSTLNTAEKIPLLTIEDGILDQNPVPTKSNRCYSGNKEREVESWLKQRPICNQAAIEAKVPFGTTCYLCHEEESHYRCLDCLPVSLCYSCVLQSHALQPLHLIAEWRPQTASLDKKNKGRTRIVGKRIKHLWTMDNQEDREGGEWFEGVVVRRAGKNYMIKYEDEEDLRRVPVADFQKFMKNKTLVFM